MCGFMRVVYTAATSKYMMQLGGDALGESSMLHRATVLPHEKLYLEHLPNAEQYYKSFMHRDTVNFVVVTKCVSFSSPSSLLPTTLTLRPSLVTSYLAQMTYLTSQDRIHHYHLRRRTPQVLEEAGGWHRIRQTLPRAPHPRHRRRGEHGRAAVCQRVGGRDGEDL